MSQAPTPSYTLPSEPLLEIRTRTLARCRPKPIVQRWLLDQAAMGWVGTPEVSRDDAIVFSLGMREVSGRTSGRWMTPGTRQGRL